MTTGAAKSLQRTVWLGAFLLTLATLCASTASPKRVLMVFREESHVVATRMIDRGGAGEAADPRHRRDRRVS